MGFVQNIIAQVLGDAGFEETPKDAFERPALADLLPYRLYDPETRFFYNESTTGFIAELSTSVTPDAIENFHSALISTVPMQGGIQILNWSSPQIAAKLDAWARARIHGNDIGEEIVASRIAMFDQKRFGSDSPIKAVPTIRRRFVAGWIESEPTFEALKKLSEYRTAIYAALGIKKEAGLTPDGFLSLLADILHADRWGSANGFEYTDDIPLNMQVPGATLKVASDWIELAGEPQLGVRAASVAQFPRDWLQQMGSMLHGAMDIISDRPHGPMLISLSGTVIPAQKASGQILSQRMKLEHSRKTGFAKFTNDLAGKEAEFQTLSDQLDQGERLFECAMTVLAYAGEGRDGARSALNEATKIFRRANFSLRHEKFLQLPMLLASLPLGVSQAHLGAFRKLMRMRLLKGAAVSALAPVHAEWNGNTNGRGMLLMGRQGELFTWSNFVSDGNYNVAVVGKSGAGKSVFMQEMINSICAGGGRALVIDDGYSFKTTCEILGGTHVALDGEREVKLNPFSMLQADKMASKEYEAEAVELITRVIGTMASLGEQREGRVAGMEEDAISAAVRKVWETKGPDGEVTDVLEVLRERAKKDERLRDVCAKLSSFARGGSFGHYFEGRASINVENALTVVELSELKTQPGLEQVVLQLVMFLGTELMYKTDRAIPVAILIDEAWDLLKGPGTAKFIEGVVRRARKYTGALITGTQSIDDYYQNPAAEVCLQNSDWTVFLAQKPETIDRLQRAGKLSLPDGYGARLKSITSVAGQFSEMAIKGSNGIFVGRLALDPFSLAVFSSKGSTVEQLNKRKAQGMTTVAALKDMVAKGEVS